MPLQDRNEKANARSPCSCESIWTAGSIIYPPRLWSPCQQGMKVQLECRRVARHDLYFSSSRPLAIARGVVIEFPANWLLCEVSLLPFSISTLNSCVTYLVSTLSEIQKLFAQLRLHGCKLWCGQVSRSRDWTRWRLGHHNF